jgi:hypothetical protein
VHKDGHSHGCLINLKVLPFFECLHVPQTGPYPLDGSPDGFFRISGDTCIRIL